MVRYGMVGGDMHAFIGEVHRKAINFDNRARLVAGCFSDIAEYNAETAREYGVSPERVYYDYAEMARAEAAREDGIDFVTIATPNYLHYEIAKEFLLAGICVMCEKPLCLEVWQARELCDIANDKGLLFGVTHGYTGYTMVKVMREMIRRGDIGAIAAVNAEYVQDWLIDQLTPDDPENPKPPVWRMNPEYNGISNCVGDIGTHIENFVCYVTGLRIKRLIATANKFGRALDLNSNMIMEYENGVNGAYWCTQIAAGSYNGLRVRVYGDKGSLEWEQHFPDYLRYTPKGEAPRTLSRGCSYITADAGGHSRIPCGHPEGLYVAFANIYKSFISAVIARKNGQDASAYDFPTARDGLEGVKFVHAVIKSAESGGAWVEM